jgi:hypothetical protein
MADQAEWMRTFESLVLENRPIKLLNTYRGLPLDTDVTILGIEEGKITTSILSYHAVCMALTGQTYLYSTRLPQTLKANVIRVDFKKKQAVLSDFSATENVIGKRRLARVEPNEVLEVQIYDGKQRLGGKLINISSEGMCIVAYFANLYGLKFKNDLQVFIDFKPPNIEKTMRSMGIITYMTSREGLAVHRLGLKIIPSPEIKPLLDDYIARRQIELVNEMEQKYLSMQGKVSGRG